MAILEKEVFVKISSANLNHYKKLGYEIPLYKTKSRNMRVKKDTSILVKVSDLPPQSNIRLTKICDECGKELENRSFASINSLRQNGDGRDRCQSCSMIFLRKKQKENLPFEKSFTYFAKTNDKMHLLKEYSEKNTISTDNLYKASNLILLWNCPDCGSEYGQYLNSRTCQSTGCPYCAGQKVNKTNCLAYAAPFIAKEWHSTKNGELSPLDVTLNSTKKVWWVCESGHEWIARISTRSIGKGCLICSSSKGEKRIREWLEDNKIKFIPQKEFKGLLGLGGGFLSYDFYIPSINTLIEYQGEFHDGTAFQQTDDEFEYQQEHDRRKRKFADSNNINLLEIWYWDFDNVESILKKEIIKGGIQWQHI